MSTIQDYIKDKKTNVIINKNDREYLEIKERRNQQKIINNICERMDSFERELNMIKNILRENYLNKKEYVS